MTSQRLLKAVVIGLGALIVIGLGALAVGMVSKFSAPHPSQTAPGQAYALPKGAVIVEMQAQPNRLVLHVRSQAGDEIDILDIADGHLVAAVK